MVIQGNLAKKIYSFLQTNLGIVILLLIHNIGSLPLGGNPTDTILYSLGSVTGKFLPTYIVVLVLSRKLKWSGRQQIVNTLLILFILPIVQLNHTLYTIQNIVFVLFIFTEVILVALDLFNGIFKKKG